MLKSLIFAARLSGFVSCPYYLPLGIKAVHEDSCVFHSVYGRIALCSLKVAMTQ